MVKIDSTTLKTLIGLLIDAKAILHATTAAAFIWNGNTFSSIASSWVLHCLLQIPFYNLPAASWPPDMPSRRLHCTKGFITDDGVAKTASIHKNHRQHRTSFLSNRPSLCLTGASCSVKDLGFYGFRFDYSYRQVVQCRHTLRRRSACLTTSTGASLRPSVTSVMTDEMWCSKLMLPGLCGGAEAPPSPTKTRPGCSSGTGPPEEEARLSFFSAS